MRPAHWSVLLCWWVVPVGVWAQPAETTAPDPYQVIAQQRQDLHRQQLQIEAECYQRFSVSGCLERSRLSYRAQLNDLKRQENLLKAEQRRARGARELQRLDANLSNARLDQERLDRQQKAEDNQTRETALVRERQAEQDAREQARLQQQTQAEERLEQHEKVLNALRAKREDEARQRAIYQEKLDAAAKRQQEQDAREAERKGPPAPLLPR